MTQTQTQTPKETPTSMRRQETVARIVATGVIPVVRAPSPDDALRAVEALRAGGLDIIELTMTVPNAMQVIDEIAKRYGDSVALGAGTVLDAATARACISAGATFVVSPILDEDTIECCHSLGAAAVPGALTPSEVVRAWRAGADLVKVFPCGAVGGPSYIRALRAPLPQIDLVPTGGVSLATVGDYIRAGARAVGAGGDLVDLALLREGKDAALSDNARRYREAVAAARRG
jgi:2-dehydro-3-deoxyphosphogluconate aldolase/(4S)-4-hydroxy-2-oxoglutarate aldolase